MTSFIVFMLILVALIVVLFIQARRSYIISEHMEETAKVGLLAVGSVVERQHQERYGEPPPAPPSGTWYPDKKKSKAHP